MSCTIIFISDFRSEQKMIAQNRFLFSPAACPQWVHFYPCLWIYINMYFYPLNNLLAVLCLTSPEQVWNIHHPVTSEPLLLRTLRHNKHTSFCLSPIHLIILQMRYLFWHWLLRFLNIPQDVHFQKSLDLRSRVLIPIKNVQTSLILKMHKRSVCAGLIQIVSTHIQYIQCINNSSVCIYHIK